MNNNIFNITFTYSPSEGDIQKSGGESIHALKDYLYYLGVQHQRKNTIARYYNAALHFINHSDGSITKESVDDYITHLNRTKKRNTIASEILGLNRYLTYCNHKELKHTIPKWETAHRDIITKEEIQKFITYSRKNCHLMDYLIILFITDLDCRPHEIAKAQWTWICGDTIYLSDCKTGNTYSYLTQELKTNLALWKEQQQPESTYIFTNYQGRYREQPITTQTQKIRALIHKLSREVIGRKLNPQDIRASVISAEFNEYINPKVIQRKARHRSFKSTMKYNHVDDKQLLDYLNTGTIFNNTERIFKQKSEITHDKRSYIKTLVPQEPLLEEDNSSFSFSLFNQTGLFTRWDMRWGFSPIYTQYRVPPLYNNLGFSLISLPPIMEMIF